MATESLLASRPHSIDSERKYLATNVVNCFKVALSEDNRLEEREGWKQLIKSLNGWYLVLLTDVELYLKTVKITNFFTGS